MAWRSFGDALATVRLTNEQRDLASQNLGLAGNAAKLVWHRGHELSDIKDLQQAAMVGLCNATRTYDPSKGVKFSTYAGKACYTAALDEAVTSGVIMLPHWHTKKVETDRPAYSGYREAAVTTRWPVQFMVKKHDVSNYSYGSVTDAIDVKDELVAAMATLSPLDRYIAQVHCNGGTMESIGNRIGLNRFQVARRIKNITARIRRQFA